MLPITVVAMCAHCREHALCSQISIPSSMGDAEAAELARALKANSSVKVLRLRYNEIRDAGAEALAGACPFMTVVCVC